MPRYHFNAQDGRCYPDEQGLELPDLDAAKAEAIGFLSDLLTEHGEEVWEADGWCITVTDDQNLSLFRLDASAIMSPATRGRPHHRT